MKKLLYIICIPLILLSCIYDVTLEETTTSNTHSVEATLTLQTPTATVDVSTRAISVGDEHVITNVEVLAFSMTNPMDDGTFAYRATATLINGTAADKSFKVILQPISGQPLQKLVVLANPGTLLDGKDFTGMSRTNALALLEMDCPTTGWKVNSSTDFTPLPMYGETLPTPITGTGSRPVAFNVTLLRALAAIDVLVDTSIRDDFKLDEIYLCNASGTGRLASATWPPQANAPTSPTGGWNPLATVIDYSSAGITDRHTLQCAIYTFEAPAYHPTNSPAAPYLILGGSWQGQSTSYYRADFYGQPDSQIPTTGYLPLLRNHQYTVVITNVSGPGYPSVTEAAANIFSGLTATTSTIDQSLDIGHVVWDGRHYLGVSQLDFDITPAAQNITAQITTNYTGNGTSASNGWKAVVSTDASSWLSITGNSTGAGDSTPYTLTINTTLHDQGIEPRTGIIIITAGRLSQTITVTQQRTTSIALDIGDVELTFAATNPQPRNLRVEWQPKGQVCNYQIISAASDSDPVINTYPELRGYRGLSFGATTGQIASDGIDPETPACNFIINPSAQTLAQFEEKRSILLITISNADGQAQSRKVLLRQFDYAISVTGMQNGDEYQLGTTYSLTVRANAQWEVTNSAGNVALLSTTGGDPNITDTGIPITFTTGNTGGTSAIFTFRLKEDNGSPITQTVNVNLVSNLPNCYIVAPGTTGFTFPVSKAFNVWATDSDLVAAVSGVDLSTGSLTTNLLWQDEPGLISSAPEILNAASRAGASIRFSTADKEGNAVIELKIGGVTRWSWHIWVVRNFNPDNNTGYNSRNGAIIMDRDLGAIRSQPAFTGDISHYGLYYQWGRKDPFPGARQATFTAPIANAGKTIYPFSGPALDEGSTGITSSMVNVPRNLVNAIVNPMIFYTNDAKTSSHQNWYSDKVSIINRTDLWGPEYKSAFDPCPEGWRVPNLPIWKYAVLPNDFENGAGVFLKDQYNNDIGYFATSGGRACNTGYYTTQVGRYNYGWQAEGKSSARNYYISNLSITEDTGHPKAGGISVRCIKIQ